MKLNPTRLSGYLLASPTELFDPETLLCSDKIRTCGYYLKKEWDKFDYYCDISLLDNEIIKSEPPYIYPLILRRSGKKGLLLSSNKKIVDHLLDSVLSKILRPSFVKVQIDIDNLIRFVARNPSKFVFSFGHARVSAFGNSLRAISFYGDDLGEASLFRDHLELMNFFACGLRKAIGGPELVRLGADGMVTFNVAREDSLNDVIDVLRYLNQYGFLNVEF